MTACCREHQDSGASSLLADSESIAFWRAIGEVAPLSGSASARVWRISIAPARGAAIGAALARALDAIWYLDWGGGLLWLAIPEQGDAAGAGDPRWHPPYPHPRPLPPGNDGHGTRPCDAVKGSPALRRAVPVFEPQPAALRRAVAAVKDAFRSAPYPEPRPHDRRELRKRMSLRGAAGDEAISIRQAQAVGDCFAEFILGRRSAPTRGLAMTA